MGRGVVDQCRRYGAPVAVIGPLFHDPRRAVGRVGWGGVDDRWCDRPRVRALGRHSCRHLRAQVGVAGKLGAGGGRVRGLRRGRQLARISTGRHGCRNRGGHGVNRGQDARDRARSRPRPSQAIGLTAVAGQPRLRPWRSARDGNARVRGCGLPVRRLWQCAYLHGRDPAGRGRRSAPQTTGHAHASRHRERPARIAAM